MKDWDEREYWRDLWVRAEQNMPAMSEYESDQGWREHKIKIRRGAATALRLCLGYSVYGKKGRSNAQCALYIATSRGQKPNTEKRQRLLKALAGPHGPTIARVRLIRLNQAHRFRHWP